MITLKLVLNDKGESKVKWSIACNLVRETPSECLIAKHVKNMCVEFMHRVEADALKNRELK